MEGVCICNTFENMAKIIAYKEIKNNMVRVCLYKNGKLYANDINLRYITEIIPKDSIHIMTNLPEYNSISDSIKYWPLLIEEKLYELNSYDNKKREIYKPFNINFQKKY